MPLRRRDRATGHPLFPGFTDVQEIGVGSLATVFRGREIDTGRLVALKLLNVRDASPRAIESFERESVALGALSSHPNIVTLFRTFRTPDGRPVLVLELCAGAVAERLHGGVGLPVQDAVAIGIKVAGALETAHRGGILHRDVKPQNILVTEFGEPALADFGVAMLQSSTQTTAGLFDFTTLHAAPELLEGGGTSAATDVYELASSLYQLIAGQSAFRAYDGESPASVILRILRDPVRPLMGAGVPMQLSDLLIRAMSKDKDHRPPTAHEFAAELADVEIAQGWPRTQFLIRGPATTATGWVPDVIRLPDAVPRSAPATPPLSAPGPGLVVPPLSVGRASEPVVSPVERVAPAVRPLPPASAPAPPAPAPPAPAPPAPAPVPPAPPGPPPAPMPPAPPALPTPPVPTVPAAASASKSPMAAPGLTAPAAATRPAQPDQPAPANQPETRTFDAAADSAAPEPAAPEPAAPEPAAPQGPARVPIDIADGDAFGFELPRPARRTAQSGHATSSAAPAAAPRVPAPPAQPPADQPPPAPLPPEALLSATPLQQAPVPVPLLEPVAASVDDPVRVEPDVDEQDVDEPDVDESVPSPSWWSPLDDAVAERFPKPPELAFSGPDAPSAPAVPTWAVRANPQFAPVAPQFVGEIAIDPNYLRPRLTVRAGLTSLTVDDQNLTMRSMLRKSRLPWSQVSAFEPHFPDGDNGLTSKGVLVALTPEGAIELPATRRLSGELRHLHALLDAYRVRAQMYANR